MRRLGAVGILDDARARSARQAIEFGNGQACWFYSHGPAVEVK
jgi:hypothetical protein